MFRLFILTASALLLLTTPSFAQQGAAQQLQPPKYPVPAHVSDAAKAVLNKPIDMARAQHAPATPQQWKQALEAAAAAYRPRLQWLKQQPLTVQPAEIAGVAVHYLLPDQLPKAHENVLLVNLHGGAYVQFAGELSVLEGASLALAGSYRVLSVDYRMPPEHPFPAAVDDAVSVYRELLKSHSSQQIALFGASAGGGLVAATIVSLRDQGLPMPAAAILNTPWSDLSKTGDSYFTLDGVDPVLPSYDNFLGAAARLYAGEAGLQHPLVSPVYADYTQGFPPSLLISGTRDLLLSCTVRLHSALRAAGQPADLLVLDAMWHGFTANPAMPESQFAQAEMLKFLRKNLIGRAADSPL